LEIRLKEKFFNYLHNEFIWTRVRFSAGPPTFFARMGGLKNRQHIWARPVLTVNKKYSMRVFKRRKDKKEAKVIAFVPAVQAPRAEMKIAA
jgi:hypothetical protein